MKKLVGIGCLLALLVTSPSLAEKRIGVGGYVHNGHSYSGDDKIDPPGTVGHGAIGTLEFDREDGLDLTWGFSTIAFTFGKRDNRTGEQDNEFAVVPSIDGSVYFPAVWGASPFIRVGVGYEIATDGSDAAIIPVYGIEKRINKRLSAEISGRHIITSERRHDLYGVMFKFSF